MPYDLTWGGSLRVDLSTRFPVVGFKRLSQALETPSSAIHTRGGSVDNCQRLGSYLC